MVEHGRLYNELDPYEQAFYDKQAEAHAAERRRDIFTSRLQLTEALSILRARQASCGAGWLMATRTAEQFMDL